MKKIPKISLIILILIISLYFFIQKNKSAPIKLIPLIPEIQVSNEPTPETSVTNTYNYLNKEKGFSLKVPSMWTFKETVFNSLVVLFAPQGSGDTIKENLGITSVEISGDLNLDTYYKQTTSMLENIINDYNLISKEEIQVNNQKAIKIIYNGTDHDQKLQREQVFFFKGKEAFVFTYTAPQDTFQDRLQDVNSIINSFNI